MSEFSQPGAGGDAFDPKEHPEWANRLFLFYPTEYIQGITTKFGEKDAVKANIVILDLPGRDGQPTKLNDAMIFAGFIIGALKGSIGGMVLGRLAQGVNVKGNPPWILTDHTPEDAAVASAYNAAHPQIAQPAPQAAPAAPGGGWGAAPAEDPWAGVNAAPTPPAAGGWGAAPATPAPPAWGAPPAAAAATAPNPAAVAAPPVAPGPTAPAAGDLRGFLQSKGVDLANVQSEEQARAIAATFPDSPLGAAQPPF